MAYTSIVDYLKSQGQDSSYSNRQKIATQLGIQNYTGTAEQNIQMLNTLQKKAATPTATPTPAPVVNNDVIKDKVVNGTNPTNTDGLLGLRSAAEGLGLNVGWSSEAGPTIGGQKVDTTGLQNINGSWMGTPEQIRAIVNQYAGVNQSSGTGYGSLPSTYKGQYDDEKKALIDKILNYQPFSYDPDNDPSYQAYADMYRREGERSYQNTMGDIAATSGDGMPSSWAVSAASQARNNYAQQLTDMIPALENQAYNRYLGGMDILRGNLNTMEGVGASDYAKYRDTVTDYENNRNYNRGVFESDRNYNRGVLESDRAFNYQASRDQVLDEQWLKQFDANEQQRIIENALQSRQISVSEANAALNRAQFNYQKEQDTLNRTNSQPPTAGQLDAYNQIVSGLSKDPSGSLSYINRLGKDFYTDLIGENLYNQLLAEAQSGFKDTLPQSSFGDNDYYKRALDMMNATEDQYDQYSNKIGTKPKYKPEDVIAYINGLPISKERKDDIADALGLPK